jgi:hypothetical protein
LGPGARTAGFDVVLRDFCYRVARSGAGRDPVALLAKEPIGITRYGKCIVGLIWKQACSLFAKKLALSISRGAWREAQRVAMPNVWAGTTLDGVQCRLDSEPAGLVAHVGKGGKKISRRVARQSTSLFECVAAMERVLDRSQTPLPLPAATSTRSSAGCRYWLEAALRKRCVRCQCKFYRPDALVPYPCASASDRRPVSSSAQTGRRP